MPAQFETLKEFHYDPDSINNQGSSTVKGRPKEIHWWTVCIATDSNQLLPCGVEL